MTTRVYFLRCTDCEWHGTRTEDERLDACPLCGDEVETHGPRSRLYGEPTADDLRIVRPSAARSPFGIPTTAPRMRPWHDGTRILPNGLRAKVVRIPSIADAFDEANLQRSESVAEISMLSGWNKVPV